MYIFWWKHSINDQNFYTEYFEVGAKTSALRIFCLFVSFVEILLFMYLINYFTRSNSSLNFRITGVVEFQFCASSPRAYFRNVQQIFGISSGVGDDKEWAADKPRTEWAFGLTSLSWTLQYIWKAQRFSEHTRTHCIATNIISPILISVYEGTYITILERPCARWWDALEVTNCHFNSSTRIHNTISAPFHHQQQPKQKQQQPKQKHILFASRTSPSGIKHCRSRLSLNM